MIVWQRRDGTSIHLDGERLRGLRLSSGWTQKSVAVDIGVTAAAVSAWETEACCPSLPQIERIRAVFGDALEESGAIVVETWIQRESRYLDKRYRERMDDPDAE
jgi:transcriptional regulator with XRE-family HTH domain